MAPPRPAEPVEAPVLAVLHAAAFPPEERWGESAIRLMLGLEGAFGLVVEGAAGPAGFILARAVAGEAEILTIAVDPSAQRGGLGATLLGAALAEVARRGASVLFLEVSERNAPARALYARTGAEPVGRRRRYYPDGSDALVLRITPPSG
ncbi:GNAT family N-acetyltransferase [Roseomonas sp. KE2513]|uniref:GNAT family N-acetyltransferase n=1 Tax=Roseomonas sp. KE2513 TaxID=2479202 RepID=UPI0018DFDE87|nr:GNAT family N-acetyltransferase [Roseomonas sp. KE2513]MBI0535879.1 GNAT family N-acetyltransferase [Roseomonas sp. KE2513]